MEMAFALDPWPSLDSDEAPALEMHGVRVTQTIARVDKAELFRIVGYQPHSGQAPMHASTARYRVLACGARFGKSLAAAMEIVAAALQPANEARGWIVAPSHDLVDRIFARVAELFRKYFGHRVIELDERRQLLRARNLGGGITEVRGKSGEQAVSLLGESLDFVVVDEAAKLASEIWEEHLSARLVDRRGWALLVSTPHGGGWFQRLYHRGQGRRDKGVESWRMPSSTNPFLSPAVLEEERTRLPKDVFAQQYLAEFVGGPPERCFTCDGPSPDVRGFHVYVTDGELPRCRECNELVDEHGHTILRVWRNGMVRTKVTRLRPMPLVESE